MLKWLSAWWHQRQRQIDLDILWPICCQQASDLDHARAAFAVHAFNDEAWEPLGADGIIEFINNLQPAGKPAWAT